MLTRILSGIVLVGALIFIQVFIANLQNKFYFTILIAGLASMVCYEWYKTTTNFNLIINTLISIILFILIVLVSLNNQSKEIISFTRKLTNVSLLLWIITFISIFNDGLFNFLKRFGFFTATGIIFLLSFAINMILAMNHFLYITLAVACSDIFGYFGGKFIGKNQLTPISPNKTIEGFLSSWFGVLFFIFILKKFDLYFLNSGYITIILIAFLVSALATLGDLVQSKFKRVKNVKDTGHIIPGHGGIWDRLDALIAVTPFWVFLAIRI